MAHEPPVPTASQSPYPLHPAPLHTDGEDRQPAGRKEGRAAERPPSSRSLAIGIGSAAIVAALIFARRR